MVKTKLRIALVGVGYWGMNLLRVFLQSGVSVTIFDVDREKLKKAKAAYPSVTVESSYNEVLQDDSINAVVLAVPAELHYVMSKEAILSGKDVFVEKPLALNVEDGAHLVELAKKNKCILMVGHLLEYHPAVNKLKELIAHGELGKIQYIYSNRLNLGRIRREENILWSFAPHDISAMIYLLNETPRTVAAFGGNYLHKDIADVTVSNLHFSSGVRGHIFVSWLHPFKEQKLIVVGDKKMAVFDDVSEKEKLTVFNHKIKWVNRIPMPARGSSKRINVLSGEPLLLECRHFIDCLKNRTIPRTSGLSALRVLSVLQACQVSLENKGAAVSINPASGLGNVPGAYYAHPTAVIDRPCEIGSGTKIWHYSHVMPGAKIGTNCIIGQNVFVASKATVGNGVKVQNNVSVYDRVVLSDQVFCGPSVVFTNVTTPRSFIERKKEFEETVVGRGATLGANATILCGTKIGEYAFIGAGAVVTSDIPAHALVYGSPARVKAWVCRCARKLSFKKGKAVCDKCRSVYVKSGDSVTRK